MAVTWLHVSDFHFPASTTHEQDVVQKALLDAAQRFHKQNHRPDLIFVTGDIANSGQSAEYDRATAYFDKLLRIHGLDRSRLFVVPGNHDVDQNAGKYLQRTLDTLTNANSFFDHAHSSDYFRKFTAFRTWYENYFGATARLFPMHTTCTPSIKLTINNQELQILSINSALFSQDKYDAGKLWIIPKCLRDAFAALDESPGAVRIALLHHPFDWLHDAERAQIESLLQQHVHIVLRGHMHKTDARQVITGAGHVLHLAAGAAYQKSERPKKAMYCTLNGTKVTVFPICFHDGAEPAWTVDSSEFPTADKYVGKFTLPSTRRQGKGSQKKPDPVPAGNPSSTTPDTDLTPLRRRLRESIDRYTTASDSSQDPFLQAWTAIKSNPPLPKLYSHCTSCDSLNLLWQIGTAIQRASELANTPLARQKLREHQLPVRMALVACERLIRESRQCVNHAPDAAPALTMTNKIAAAIVAAAWNRLNIVLYRSVDGVIEIPHLIDDFAAPSLGHETLRDVADKEIKKRLDIWRGIRTTDTVPTSGHTPDQRISKVNLKSGLEVYEQETGTRFFVAIDQTRLSGHFDPDLANYLNEQWRIPLFRFNCPAANLSDDEKNAWEELQSNLLDHIQTILLSPTADTDDGQQPDNTPAATNSAMPAASTKPPIVFVSYAHNDKIASEIIETIRALERQKILTLWYDGHLQVGQEWEAEILGKIASCDVAVLLISTAFLSSEFIQNTEVPLLAKRASETGIPLLPILIEPTDWEAASWLKKLQMLLTKEHGLSSDTEKRRHQLIEISKAIRTTVSK